MHIEYAYLPPCIWNATRHNVRRICVSMASLWKTRRRYPFDPGGLVREDADAKGEQPERKPTADHPGGIRFWPDGVFTPFGTF